MSPERLWLAAAVLAAYGGLCAAVAARVRRARHAAEREAAALAPGTAGVAPVWVIHASQTGQAEALARQTARTLHDAGVPVRLSRLGELTLEALAGAERALFVAATYGEGDPPDAAAAFAHDAMGARDDGARLAGLSYGVLALGDSTYAHFCGFGRSLDAWLRRHDARPLFERIDVDRSDAGAIGRWREQLVRLAGTAALADWEAPAFARWRIEARRLLNPGSAGEPAYHVELAPADGAPLPDWEAGDLAQLRLDEDAEPPRDYSIASVPADGRVHLLVRRARRDDGSHGLASGLLTGGAPVGATVALRLRANPGFRIGDNAARPWILVGNGSGLAGLRAHLRQRAAGPHRAAGAWLVFGERSPVHDAFHRDEIERWLAEGVLERVDFAWSRAEPRGRHVQHVLAGHTDLLRARVEAGAAILVCGSVKGMAPAVDAALRAALGDGCVDRLLRERRYLRDVY